MVQQEKADHLIVQDFFDARGLIADPIPEPKASKTPDFAIRRGAEVVAFCEVKSPQDIFTERVHDAITHVTQTGERIGGIIEIGYGNDYRQSRCIAKAAKKAALQFDSVNPTHSIPNILMIVNHDAHSNDEDFSEALIGYFRGVRTGKALRDEISQMTLTYGLIGKKIGRGIERVAPIIYRHANLKEAAQDMLELD
jgi:hypothetical protein